MPSIAAVSISSTVQKVLDFLPNILGFLVILVIGYVIAKLVQTIVAKALNAVHLDRRLHESEAGEYVEKVSPGASPANLIGAAVFWLIFLFALSAAIGALKIPAVTALMNRVLGYLPNVIAAVIIFVIAAAVAGAIGGAVHKTMGDTPTGKIVRAAVPALVMGIAVFMVLNQLKIAPAIVQITYIAPLGSVAVSAALAFGLGGRDVAARLLSQAYEKGQETKDQVKQDMQLDKDRAQQQAQSAKDKADAKVNGDTATTGAYRAR
jgi:hypothetical protein